MSQTGNYTGDLEDIKKWWEGERQARLECLKLAVSYHNAHDNKNWDVLETAEKYYQWVNAKTADNQPLTND